MDHGLEDPLNMTADEKLNEILLMLRQFSAMLEQLAQNPLLKSMPGFNL